MLLAIKLATIAISAAFVNTVFGQGGVSDLPACARTCAFDSIPASCGANTTCICESTEFIAGVTCCVSRECTPADIQKSIDFSRRFCGDAASGLPTAAICASTASVATPTAAATSSGVANHIVAQGFGAMGAAVLGAAALI